MSQYVILFPLTAVFFFYWYGDHRDLHSFPTRRSSDLPATMKRFTEKTDQLHGKPVIRRLQIKDIDRKSTRLNSSHSQISYAVFCLKKKKKTTTTAHILQ